MKDKENVVIDFNKMIKKSWTYAKLTECEKDKWRCILTDVRLSNSLKGTYNQRWEILNLAYASFLYGVGYTGFNWRESGE